MQTESNFHIDDSLELSNNDKKDSKIILISVWFVFLVASHYSFFSSGFDLIRGNMLDPRFIVAILEHWHQVFIGRQEFLRPLYFFPASQNPLAFSDTLFLNSFFYSFCRFFVADEFLAFQGAQILFLLFGYLTFFYLTRQILKCSYLASLSGSLIFTFAAPMIRLLPAFQNSSTFFLPLLGIFFAKFIESATSGKSKQYLYLGLFWLLLGAMAFSTFYTVWFLFLFTFFLGLSFVVFYKRRISLMRMMLKPMLFSSVMAPICFLPFLLFYWPMMGAKRDYEEVFGYLYVPADLPNGNTPIWKYFLTISRPTELNVYPPTIGFFAAICLGAFIYLIIRKRLPTFGKWKDALILSLCSSLVICLILLMKFDTHAAWWFVYSFVPGAGAIRVVCRLFLIFAFFAAVFLSLILSSVVTHKKFRICKILLIPFVLLAVADQIGMPASSISRSEEFARLGNIKAPPFRAKAFVLAKPEATVSDFDIYHIDAMLVANRINKPTFFGYSGWLPTGYTVRTLPDLSAEFYNSIDAWASLQKFRGVVAVYNTKTGRWSPYKTKP